MVQHFSLNNAKHHGTQLQLSLMVNSDQLITLFSSIDFLPEGMLCFTVYNQLNKPFPNFPLLLSALLNLVHLFVVDTSQLRNIGLCFTYTNYPLQGEMSAKNPRLGITERYWVQLARNPRYSNLISLIKQGKLSASNQPLFICRVRDTVAV